METKLKIKLEDIVLLGENITKLAQEVYGLHRKIVNVQEPKTPTKEQIKTIIGNVPREFNAFWYDSNLTSFIIFVITEWERIRNVDARIEKNVQNNIGTKDWLDFYDAINSNK